MSEQKPDRDPFNERMAYELAREAELRGELQRQLRRRKQMLVLLIVSIILFIVIVASFYALNALSG